MDKLIIMGIAVCSFGLAACSSSKADNNSNSTLSMFSSFKTIKASKHYVSKSVSLKDFSALETVGSFDVEYKHDDRPHAELYMPDNVISYLDIVVRDNKLRLAMKDNINVLWGNDNKARIIVYAPSVNELSLIGSGNLAVNETLQGNQLTFRLMGSGDFDIRNLKANTVDARLSGSGDFDILSMEVAKDAGLSVMGSGDLDINSLKSEKLSLSTMGSGDLNVANISADRVSASVTGSSDMRLKGIANVASFAVTGSGDLDAGQLKVKDAEARATGSGGITCYATGKTNFKANFTSSIRNLAQ